jgi:SAM-dependent methyltransferase
MSEDGPSDDATAAADPDGHARRLAAEALARDAPTAWFERLYAAAEAGEAVVPWDRGAPHRLLAEWTQEHRIEGAGRRALIVGSGLGDDAEHIAGLGFDTVAFEVSETAIRSTRRRYPGSTVDYLVADLLDPPASWDGAFELVVESLTIQALPRAPRPPAIANVARMVAPGGTLIVIASAWSQADGDHGPPWPLTRAEIESFGNGGLRPVQIEDLADAAEPAVHRWRAEFQRPR